MSAPIRVVVADDSVLLREGLVRLLEDSGFEVAGQAGDAEDLLRKVGAHKPDVAVVDVRMPPTHTDEGLRAAHAIRKEHPGVGVLVLSQYVEEAYALELLSQSTESTGYLLKDRVADVDSFTDAVRRVAGGGSALDPEVVALLLGRRRREDPLQSITPREREVLGLMAEGRSNAAIAEALVVTERAVEKHVTSIFSKLDLAPTVVDHRRVLAVLALAGVSLSFPRGQFTAIMGPSGSGKSTLMHLLAGLDKPTSGSVVIDGQELAGLDDKRLTALRRDKLGFVFQAFNLIPVLSARENILLPLMLAGTKAQDGWLDTLVDAVGLRDRLTHRPSELSGGQQQRVAIARALVSRPTVVFADEPTGNLDSKTGGEILELLHESVDNYGQTMVMVTHEARAAAAADRILFLADGRIVKDLGRADEEQILETIRDVTLA